MHLLTRAFRSKPGRERDLINALRNTAVRMIQQLETLSVLMCQQSDDRQQLVWIENRGRESRVAPSSLGGEAIEAWRELLAHASAAISLEFLDGSYRFPLPPCEVWSLEVDRSDSEGLKAVLELARRVREDGHVVGMSLYRTVEISPAVTGFVALPLGVRPEDLAWGATGHVLETQKPRIVWHPLSVLWTAGRLSSDPGPGVSFTRYPRTAFLARSRPEPSSDSGAGASPEQAHEVTAQQFEGLQGSIAR